MKQAQNVTAQTKTQKTPLTNCHMWRRHIWQELHDMYTDKFGAQLNPTQSASDVFIPTAIISSV